MTSALRVNVRYARLHLLRAMLFASGSRIASRNDGWIDTTGINDILHEVGASHALLVRLTGMGLVERRRIQKGSKQVSEYRPTSTAREYVKEKETSK